MNRIDRLTAILILLQTRKVIRARDIADRYEISVRTVYRDIRALEEAGVPIGAETGSGYFLAEGYHLPPVMFTRDEAGALLIGSKLMNKFSDISVSRHFTSAMDKITSVLHDQEKDHIATLESLIEVLKTSPVARDGFPNHFLGDIQSILGQNKIIRIEYHSGYKDELTTRAIEPLGLCFYASFWHLIAFCRLRNDYRDFRVDRIKGVAVTEEGFNRDQHDSLQDLIQKIVFSTELQSALIRFDHKTARTIRDWKYYYGFVEQREMETSVEMSFLVSNYDYLAQWLLTFMDKVQVVSPDELKDLLKQYAAGLSAHYLS